MKIQTWFGARQVRAEIKNVHLQRKVVPFHQAKKIGLLYDATDDKDFEVIKEYLKSLRNQHKEVRSLGYVNSKKIPGNKFAQYGLDFFCRKDLNWKGIPDGIVINNFIREDFDIIVNLNTHIFPLCYIAAVSRAKFRVGKFNSHYLKYYEMMINSENTNLQQSLEETEKYLKNLKT